MTSPTILHVDMDAFFASVEQLDNPALRGKCLVVGGVSSRAVVAAASYEARKFGIHSAMPIFQARKKCPALVIVAPRRKRYVELSVRIMSILRAFSPLVEPVSVDEAFVDITGCARLMGEPCRIAEAVKSKIKAQTGLSCSVGLAPNKFLAKIGSDYDKPDGLTLISPDQAADFIRNLPIAKVPGVGDKARQKLHSIGITTLGQAAGVGPQLLTQKLGKFGQRLYELSMGIDDSPVTPTGVVKSVSSEVTLPQNTLDRRALAVHILAQAQSVARQLRRRQLSARVVTLKIKTADFQRHSRSHSLVQPTSSSDTIYRTGLDLLDHFVLPQAVRLIGLAAAGLLPETVPIQQELFKKGSHIRHHKWESIDRALDAVAERYGHSFVVRGALLDFDPREDE